MNRVDGVGRLQQDLIRGWISSGNRDKVLHSNRETGLGRNKRYWKRINMLFGKFLWARSNLH